MKSLAEQIQFNCHISDAQYAGNYTLCIYLLKMREFYRWESRLPFTQKIDNNEIGSWLTERENYWDGIEEQPLNTLNINQQTYDCFDSDEINQQLEKDNLVYSGGYGLYGKPVFFLGELLHKEILGDVTLYISGKELARDLAAPPGMMQNKNIFIRRESLRRFIWEKYEESWWHNQENALSRALGSYDFKNHPEDALDKMTDNEVDTVLQHEIGEIQAGKILGDAWEEMLTSLPHSQADVMARAVRDNIADMLSTLPKLLAKNEPAQIHFYFANLSSMRKMIFPSLPDAYKGWLENKDTDSLIRLVDRANAHWIDIAERILDIYKQCGDQSQTKIEALVNDNYF